jgi:glycosyltransferase involved in cell wall biosynthesis
MQHGISLCMIVRDEEAVLGRCLESAKGVADEIVIVDTGSTDSSAQIGERYGAKVLAESWANDFSKARNAAIDAASGEWILVLDADEELPAESRKKIRDVTSGPTADGVELTVRSSMPETDILKFEDTKIIRLFRNRKDFRYIMPVHEQIRSSIEKSGGVIIPSDILIFHHGYSQGFVQGKQSRWKRNLEILNNAVSSSPGDPYLHYQLGVTLMSSGRTDDAYGEFKTVLDLDHEKMGGPVLERFYMKASQLALEKNRHDEAIRFARKSLDYNPRNSISMYVVAISLLSSGKIAEGYEQLLKIKEMKDESLRLDLQLEHLLKACKELLKI